MTTVGSRELKNRLGKYLKMVRQGRPVQVTDRGEPVALILPAISEPGAAYPSLRVLGKGGIRFGLGKLNPRRRPARMSPGKSIAEMIAEDRR